MRDVAPGGEHNVLERGHCAAAVVIMNEKMLAVLMIVRRILSK